MEIGGRGEIRQRTTLLDQLSLFQQQQPSSNLRDLLKVRDDAGRDPSAGPAITLAAVLASDKNSPSESGAAAPSSPRTLLEVIRDDESRDDATAAGRSSWRELTGRLRLRHAAAATSWTVGSASSVAEAPIPATTTAIRVSLMTLMELREREEEREEEEPAAAADVEVEETEEEDDDVAEARRRDLCCVCMVRKKGAAFIPCGHTFCRPCSREMLAGRGNCPLCNGAIAEVLDIF